MNGASAAKQGRLDEIVDLFQVEQTTFSKIELLKAPILDVARDSHSIEEFWKMFWKEMAAARGYEQPQVVQTPQDQLVNRNHNNISNGITTGTSGGGWRAVHQPPLDNKKATQQNKERCTRAAESIACGNVDSKFTTDYTSKLTTNEKFKSREDLIEWAQWRI